MKRRSEATFKPRNVLFVALGSGRDCRLDGLHELVSQEIRWVYVYEEAKVDDVVLILVPSMDIKADVMVFQQVLDLAV